VIIPDIGIKKLVEDGFLPPGLTIGPTSVDLTLSDSFSWSEPEKDKNNSGRPFRINRCKQSHSTSSGSGSGIYMSLFLSGRSTWFLAL